MDGSDNFGAAIIFLRNSEISNLENVIFGDKNVQKLDISMIDLLMVDIS
jgi:hypothetical protein